MNLFKRALTVLAALCCLIAAGCSNHNSSSSGTDASSSSDTSYNGQDSSQSEPSGNQDISGSEAPAEVEQGEKIKAAANFFDNEKYEYVCKVTGTGADATLSFVKNIGVCRQTTEYSFGSTVIYCKGADTYRYDNMTNAYVKQVGTITTEPEGNLITQTIKEKLPPTRTHINAQDAEKYDVEEYTYTGATYITVLDFYFDKATGMLSKYTSTYCVEGEDDEVETRQVLRMTQEAGSIEFSENKLHDNYTDFNALTENEREAFCKELMEKLGVKDEDLYSAGLTTFDFKKISYDDLLDFVIGFKAQHSQTK